MQNMKLVPIRVCSPNKAPIPKGYLHEIYVNHMLQAFFKAFKETGYAVLSRKLGVCMGDRQYENYGDFEMINGDLLDLLKTQAPYYANVTFVYWNHRPITHNVYINKMRAAGFTVIEKRTLAEIKELIQGSHRHSHDELYADGVLVDKCKCVAFIDCDSGCSINDVRWVA